MASLSPALKLMLLALGESGVYGYNDWGEVLVANLNMLENALTGKSDIAVTSADVTLTDDQQRSLYLNLSGTLTGNRAIITKADQDGFWFVKNGTSGAYTVTIKPSGGTGVTVTQGFSAVIYSDGTDATTIIESADLSSYLDATDIGVSVQAYDADLAAIAGLSSAGMVTRTGAGTAAARTITGTANEVTVSDGAGASGNPTLSLPTVAKPYGKQAVPIPAGAMKSRSTNGAATGTAEMSTNKNMFVTLDFDASTQEFAQFSIAMPKSWDEGTVTFKPIWSHAATTTNFGVVWSLAGVALSDDDAGDAAFGTAQTSTDTGGTTNDIYIGPESAAITIAGSPAAEDLVMFQVARVPSNGSDTMAIDARLHGIVLFITTDAGNDA